MNGDADLGIPAGARGTGLFVDLDGTLADSMPALRAAYEAFLRAHGAEPSEAGFARLNGVPLGAIAAALAEAHGLAGDLAVLDRDCRERIARAHRDAAALPGARDLLAAARARGLRVAVVTAGEAPLARSWLEARGLDALVDVVVGTEGGLPGKPAPDLYRAALVQTASSAACSLAIEDSLHGATAAVAAGLATYVRGPRPEEPAAWPRVEGFVEDLAALIERLPAPLRIRRADRALEVVEVDAAPPALPRPVADAVDRAWAREVAARPDRVDGSIFHARSLAPERIEGGFVPYRRFLVALREPALAPALGVRALAVTGLVRLADGILLGRRSARVLQDPGRWELVPSGGVSPRARAPGGAISLAAQALEELEEEVGLERRRVSSIEPFALVEDLASGVVDVGLALRVDAGAADAEAAFARLAAPEHDALAVIPEGDLAAFAASNRSTLAPVTRALIEAWTGSR